MEVVFSPSFQERGWGCAPVPSRQLTGLLRAAARSVPEPHRGIWSAMTGLLVAKKSQSVAVFMERFIELVYNTVFLIVWVLYLKHVVATVLLLF